MDLRLALVMLGIGCAAVGSCARAGSASEIRLTDPLAADCWIDDAGEDAAWSEGTSSLGTPTVLSRSSAFGDGSTTLDSAVEGSQFLTAPPTLQAGRQPVQTRTPTRAAARTAAAGSLASMPYMIGDTGAGTCLGFSGLLDVGLAHPTLACSRLNIAEANTPLPTDRVYYSYRHFENATPVSVYQIEKELDVDRHTIAFEKTYWDGMCSVEVRTPIEERLTSSFISDIRPGGSPPNLDLISAPSDRRTELGNISLIFKSLLFEREAFALSGGLGVTLPTARDVEYSVVVQGTVDYASQPGLSAVTDTAFSTVFSNETVYLMPFLAWMYAEPESRWFHQGFLQVETAANPSHVTSFGIGSYAFNTGDFYSFQTGDSLFLPLPVRNELFSQTLLRANLGWGYNFWESEDQKGIARGPVDRLAGLFEVHYTSTLDDANLSTVQLSSIGTTPPDLQDIRIGNLSNRVDILNLASGASLMLGNTVFTAGAVVPLRDCPDCGFDIEYNAQVQRRF